MCRQTGAAHGLVNQRSSSVSLAVARVARRQTAGDGARADNLF
jgi:ribosomal protein S14